MVIMTDIDYDKKAEIIQAVYDFINDSERFLF